jgi:hypothetical protein
MKTQLSTFHSALVRIAVINLSIKYLTEKYQNGNSQIPNWSYAAKGPFKQTPGEQMLPNRGADKGKANKIRHAANPHSHPQPPSLKCNGV